MNGRLNAASMNMKNEAADAASNTSMLQILLLLEAQYIAMLKAR